MGDGSGYIFDTIMVLYFIILHEFYINKYYELQNYDAKFGNYFDYYITEKNSRSTRSDIESRINQSLRAKKDFFVFKNLRNLLFLAAEDASFNNF